MWLCSVHNMINERLGKPEFDCLTLNDVYDCGCGPEGEDGKAETTAGKAVEKISEVKDKVLNAKEAVKEKIVDTKEKVVEKGKEVVKDVKEKAAEVGITAQGVAAAAAAEVAPVANPIPTEKEEVIYRPRKAAEQAVEIAKKAKEAIIPKPVPSIKEDVVKPIPIELSNQDEEAEEDDSGLLDEGQEKDGSPPEKEI
jgi:hypothetical protein